MSVKIQEVTTSQKLIKKFALVGQISPQLDETIVPVVVLDDLSKLTPDDVPCFGGVSRAAVVAEYSHVSLVNPPGSGVLLKIDAITVNSGTSGIVLFHSGGYAGATVNPSYRDSRLWTQGGVPQVPISRLMHHTNVGQLGNLRCTGFVIYQAYMHLIPDLGIIIAPGDDLTLIHQYVNATLSVMFLYRQTVLSG